MMNFMMNVLMVFAVFAILFSVSHAGNLLYRKVGISQLALDQQAKPPAPHVVKEGTLKIVLQDELKHGVAIVDLHELMFRLAERVPDNFTEQQVEGYLFAVQDIRIQVQDALLEPGPAGVGLVSSRRPVVVDN